MTPKLEGSNSGASGGVGWIATGLKKSSSTVLGGGHAFGPMEDSQICGGAPTPTTCPTTPPPLSTTPPKQSPRIVRRRSALKLDTPKAAPLASSPPKATPDSISVNARSSSVVAPSRDGKAGMLFSRAELRLPRSAPLSAGNHGRTGSFGSSAGRDFSSARWNGAFLSTGSVSMGGDGGGGGGGSVCLSRASPTFATVREEEATRRCFTASAASPSTSSISPPRLAALDASRTTRSRRASADGRLQMLTSGRATVPTAAGGSTNAAAVPTPTAASAAASAAAVAVYKTCVMEKGVTLVSRGGGGGGGALPPSPAYSCRSTPAPSPDATVYPTEDVPAGSETRPRPVSRLSLVSMPSLIEMPTLIDPAVGEADYLADYACGQRKEGGGGGGEGDVLGSARSSSARGTTSSGVGERKSSWGRSRSRGGVRGHTGMSVAEFADKVAALAADVAGVFGMTGRKTVSPPVVACGLQQPGVE